MSVTERYIYKNNKPCELIVYFQWSCKNPVSRHCLFTKLNKRSVENFGDFDLVRNSNIQEKKLNCCHVCARGGHLFLIKVTFSQDLTKHVASG